MSVTYLTGGVWLCNLYGWTFEGGHPEWGYCPFGEFPHLGKYRQTLDPAVQTKIRAGEPIPQLKFGVGWAKGAEVVFEDIDFK